MATQHRAFTPAGIIVAVFDRRLWGFIPLLFFALKLWQYLPPADTWQIFWFCNLSNLMLALAIFARVPNLVFICATLLTVGLPIWIFDFIMNGDFHPFSILTHTASPVLGFLVACRLGWTKHVLWETPLYYIALQLLARLFTPAVLNINVAFAIYAPVKGLFPSFWLYSLSNLVGLTAFTWFTSKILGRFARRDV